MTDESRLDRVYAQLLRHHPYGWAIYKKVSSRDVFPGSCGYFDADGDWRTLLNLTDPGALDDDGWTIPDDGIYSAGSPESMTWGPKNSASVQSRRAGGAAGATAASSPVGASVIMSFESQHEVGAVLTTENPVWKQQMSKEASAIQWMASNTPDVIRRYRSIIKQHGIWIVTKTYATRRCGIAVMTAKSSTVEIGLEADVQGMLTLAPKSSWSHSTRGSYTEVHEDEGGVVVFISGLYFSKRLFGSRLNHSQSAALSPGDEEEEMELDLECWPSHDDSGSEYESESE